MFEHTSIDTANHLSVRLHAGFNANVMLGGLMALYDLTGPMVSAVADRLFPTLTTRITLLPAAVNAIAGWRCEVKVSEKAAPTGHDATPAAEPQHSHGHVHRSLATILAYYDQGTLSEPALQRAEAIWLTLAHAEARVHGTTPEHVHFHEVGRLSNVVAIGLIAHLMTKTGVTLSASPVPVTDGVIHCAHGLVANPAPSLCALLTDLPVRPLETDGEPITPTGLAILRGLKATFGPWPAMSVARIETVYTPYVFPDVPNGARFVLGTL